MSKYVNIEQFLEETKQFLEETEAWRKTEMQSVEETLNNIKEIDNRIDALWKDALNV